MCLLTACNPKSDASQPQQRSSAAPGPQGPATASVATLASAMLTPNDRVTILQKTLDLDRLKPFWHPELRGRVPLAIAKNSVVTDSPPLTAFGAPVVFVDGSTRGPFELAKLEVVSTDPLRARVDFTYPQEGVVGHALFESRRGTWMAIEAVVRER